MPQDDDKTIGDDLDANLDDISSQDNGLNFNDGVENLGEVNNVAGMMILLTHLLLLMLMTIMTYMVWMTHH